MSGQYVYDRSFRCILNNKFRPLGCEFGSKLGLANQVTELTPESKREIFLSSKKCLKHLTFISAIEIRERDLRTSYRKIYLRQVKSSSLI